VAIKIENQVERKLPKDSLTHIEQAFDSLPREHTRGLERIRLVEFISEPRLRGTFEATQLPGLYHPRQGPKGAWLELAMGVLLPANKPIQKRIVPRLSFKGNLTATIFSLVGQHYHLTLKHSLKKTQLEPAIRAYTEKHLRPGTKRSTLFAPNSSNLFNLRWSVGPKDYKNGRRLRRRSSRTGIPACHAVHAGRSGPNYHISQFFKS